MGCLIPKDNDYYLNCNKPNEIIDNDMKYSEFCIGLVETKIEILKNIQEKQKKESYLFDYFLLIQLTMHSVIQIVLRRMICWQD